MSRGATVGRRCTAPVRNGDRCRNRPLRGREGCKQHSGTGNVGRRSKLTAKVTEDIATVLADVIYMRDATINVGLDESTINNWLRKGRADQEAGKDTEF